MQRLGFNFFHDLVLIVTRCVFLTIKVVQNHGFVKPCLDAFIIKKKRAPIWRAFVVWIIKEELLLLTVTMRSPLSRTFVQTYPYPA